MAARAKKQSLSTVDERSSDRERLLLEASLDIDGEKARAPIHNLSATGFLIELDRPLRPGSSVNLEVTDGVSRSAQVIWISGTLHGCTFETPISPASLKKALAASPVVWPRFTVALEGPEGRKSDSASKPWGALPNVLDEARKLAIHYDAIHYDEEVASALPPGKRLQIILGMALAAWCLFGLAGWLIINALAAPSIA